MKFAISCLLLLIALPAFGKQNAPESKLVNQVSKFRFEVSQAAVERDLKNPADQLSTFVALPDFGSGFFSGIRLSSFSKNCLLPKFGIRSGDVVETVNGHDVRGPSDIMEIGKKLSKAKPGSKVRVNLRRGSQDLIYTYLVVD